jgi:DNA-binding CsgD family transcriptional regulator
MLLLCLYPILTSSAQEVIEVARVHHSTIIRSEGEWDFLESAEAKLAKREIGRLQQALTLLSKPFPGYEKLTRREYMVLAQTMRGASSKEAARVLGISSRTVEFHRANLLKKLGARNVADLVRLALKND